MDEYCKVVMLVSRLVIVEGIVKKSDSQRIGWQKSKAVWSNLRKKCCKSSPVTVIVGAWWHCLVLEHRETRTQNAIFVIPLKAKRVGRYKFHQKINRLHTVYKICLSVCDKVWSQLSQGWQNRLKFFFWRSLPKSKKNCHGIGWALAMGQKCNELKISLNLLICKIHTLGHASL